MFRPYWVIFRQRIYWKKRLLHCFASSRGIIIRTSYFAPCLRPLYVVGVEPLVLLCVRLMLIWSLILTEEHRLRMFENTVLTRIFGPKWDEVTGGWRKLPDEELRNMYSSPSIIRMIKSRGMRWTGHIVRMGKKRNAWGILAEKLETTRKTNT
jgi:hypothetical protein